MDEDIQSLLGDPLAADTPGFRVRPVIAVAADSLIQTSGIDGLLAGMEPELSRDLRSAVLSLLFDDSLRLSRGYLANPPGGIFDVPERRRVDLRGTARRFSGMSASDAATLCAGSYGMLSCLTGWDPCLRTARLELGVFMEACCCSEEDSLVADTVTDGCGNIIAALPAGMMNGDVLETIGKTLGCEVGASDGTVSTYGVGSPEMPLTCGADFLSGRALVGTLEAFALQDMVAGALFAMSSGPWTDRGEMVLETRAERIGLDTVGKRAHLPAGKGRGGELVLRASGFDSDGAYGGFPWRP